jgi:three-Cys-motif partner protein
MEPISGNSLDMRDTSLIALSDYAGREQAYVKHVFLDRYLERLVHKIASTWPHVVYVDGFAGPWQSANEKFHDTSFGIALNALREARASWAKRGRDVRMSAFLVEREAEPYKDLARVPAKYPDLDIRTNHSDFLSVLPEILKAIPTEAFAFFLIDPKGWRIPLAALKSMLARPNTEVIFNFMFDFINRAASMEAAATGLNELMPHDDWRAKLEAAEATCPGGLTALQRKAILVEAFGANLTHFGNYDYVAETTVLRPVKDRPLYCLFYATRHSRGLEVFRDCQAEALKEQAKIRASTKLKHAEAKTGQGEIFRSLHEMGPNDLTEFLEAERVAAMDTLLRLTPEQPGAIRYDRLWPEVLVHHVIRKTEVNKLAARLRKEGRLIFPEWEKGRQVPQAHYRTQRPSQP